MIKIIRYRKANVTVQYSIQEKPTPGTFGDYILLKRKLESQGEGKVLEAVKQKDPKRYKQMVFNMAFLKEMRRKHKRLHCVYCGKRRLRIYEFSEKCRRSDMATADHYLPKSLYPNLEFDKTNLRVCCDSCNSKKGSELWYEKFKYKQLKDKDYAKEQN